MTARPRATADPVFFPGPAELRAWLGEHHDTLDEAWVGLHKKGTGKPSITWPQLVDQLLCFGWIDGVRKSLGEESWMIRVTPRRPGSIWSAVNEKRAGELVELGWMEPAGRAAFEARDRARTNLYSFERETAELGEELEAEFRSRPAAWAFFQAQPPSYRKMVTHWVVSAKREDTRKRRLARLIADSGKGLRLGP